MWPYWLMFLIPLTGVSGRVDSGGQRVMWAMYLFLIAVLIGFRFDVGGDWSNYLRHFDNILYLSFSEVLQRSDPGYYVLNWLVADAGWSIIWVNAFCALLVAYGIHVFCREQPLPWLALLVAVPYLIIVVSMGYSRQAAALGLALVGLTALGKHETRKFVFWVLLGALFHKSAVILLPIAGLAATQRRIWTLIWVAAVSVLGAYFLVSDDVDSLWSSYVTAEYAFASQGATIRVIMNAVPSIILLLFRRKIFYNHSEKKLWLWMAFFSLICIFGLSYSPTATDRLALYFIPIQLFAFSRLPYLSTDKGTFNLLVGSVVAYYALVLFVWLNFATHAFAWLPYRISFFS